MAVHVTDIIMISFPSSYLSYRCFDKKPKKNIFCWKKKQIFFCQIKRKAKKDKWFVPELQNNLKQRVDWKITHSQWYYLFLITLFSLFCLLLSFPLHFLSFFLHDVHWTTRWCKGMTKSKWTAFWGRDEWIGQNTLEGERGGHRETQKTM